jgi:hypothetical protein
MSGSKSFLLLLEQSRRVAELLLSPLSLGPSQFLFHLVVLADCLLIKFILLLLVTLSGFMQNPFHFFELIFHNGFSLFLLLNVFPALQLVFRLLVLEFLSSFHHHPHFVFSNAFLLVELLHETVNAVGP